MFGYSEKKKAHIIRKKERRNEREERVVDTVLMYLSSATMK